MAPKFPDGTLESIFFADADMICDGNFFQKRPHLPDCPVDG